MLPECDSAALFREINGQCNNLKDGRTLWGSMTISMRRELPAITDLYQIGTYSDLLTPAVDRQGNKNSICRRTLRLDNIKSD